MRNIIRLFKGAGILNLLGMTVAFAAIYIIMVQVNYERLELQQQNQGHRQDICCNTQGLVQRR